MTKRSADTTVEVLRIDDLETVRLVSDATRMAILQAFAADPTRPLTVKRLGQVLGMPGDQALLPRRAARGPRADPGRRDAHRSRASSRSATGRRRPRFEIDRSRLRGDRRGRRRGLRAGSSGRSSTASDSEVADGVRSGSIVIGESGDREPADEPDQVDRPGCHPDSRMSCGHATRTTSWSSSRATGRARCHRPGPGSRWSIRCPSVPLDRRRQAGTAGGPRRPGPEPAR